MSMTLPSLAIHICCCSTLLPLLPQAIFALVDGHDQLIMVLLSARLVLFCRTHKLVSEPITKVLHIERSLCHVQAVYQQC